MNALEKLQIAIKKNEFKDFLLGNGMYKIQNREGYYTDRSAVLYSGIYRCYNLFPSFNINKVFENELKKLINGNEFELLTAFDYLWDQLIAEEKNISPFEMDKNVYIELKKSIELNKEKLKKYNFFDFGMGLQEGAFQYIENINNALDENYGHKIL